MLENLGLTNRAIAMLSLYPRSLVEQVTEEAEIKNILLKKGCPINHKIVEFQINFAGYLSTTGYGMKIRLGMTKYADIYEEDDHWFCQFATFEPDNAPADLMMDEQGKVYWEENPIPLAASIEVFVESAALSRWFRERTDILYFLGGEDVLEIEPAQVATLNTILTGRGMKVAEEATDEFEQWWLDGDSAVHAFKIWSSDGSRVGVEAYIGPDNGYISPEERREEFVTLFRELNNIPLKE